MGPLVTSLTLGQYFNSAELWTYIVRTLTLQNWGGQSLGYFNLPGVFDGNPYPRNVNAPLWSLVAEVFAYILVALLFASGGLSRTAAVIVFSVVVVDSLLPQKILFHWLPQASSDFSALPFCFALGGMFAIFKDRITLSPFIVMGLIALAYIFSGSMLHNLLIYAAFFIAMLLLSATRPVRALRLPYDISYGAFLFGWPIQQWLAHSFPSWPHSVSLLAAVVLACVFGIISFIVCEKPAQEMGRRLAGSSAKR